MAKKIAFMNQKGGVGKTTSALCLADVLFFQGYKVLLVDIDAQANSTAMTIPNPDELTKDITDVLLTPGTSLSDIIVKSRLGYDLAPSSIKLSSADIHLSSVIAREFILKTALSRVEDLYHYIIIDCPPTFNNVTINALIASDLVLSPLLPSTFSMQAVKAMTESVNSIKSLNPNLGYYYFLTQFDNRLKNYIENAEYIKGVLPNLLPTVIRIDNNVRRVQDAKVSILKAGYSTKSFLDYSDLLETINEIFEGEKNV